MQEESTKARTGLAILAVLESGEFPGIGVYMASELFCFAGEGYVLGPVFLFSDHHLGLPLHLTQAELFDCPSRTGRLVEAYYFLAQRAQTELWYVPHASLSYSSSR